MNPRPVAPMETPLPAFPLLLSEVAVREDAANDSESSEQVRRLLKRLDGKTPIDDIIGGESSIPAREIEELLLSLDGAGLIDDKTEIRGRPGADVILEIEDMVEALCARTIYRNPFWQTCLAAQKPGDFPERLAIGMIIENWHFLFRESYFDAPVLSYVPNTAVRLLLNRFFSEEYGHDDILLTALNYAGFSREDMHDAIPLPETMGLCNALAYWAHSDPLFFFTTLGLLEGQGGRRDSFIDACERSGLPEPLIEPLRTHANINLGAAHGGLTRLVFRAIEFVDEKTISRLKRQTGLFIELYDNFYTSVWRYYTSDAPLLRRVSHL